MEIKKFTGEINKQYSKIINEDIVGIGSFNSDNQKSFKNAELTLLFNLAMYNIAKKRKWQIKPERKVKKKNAKGGHGRGSFSDIAFFEKNTEKPIKPIIEIEHENSLNFEKIEKNLSKLLSKSVAKYKILIMYKDVDKKGKHSINDKYEKFFRTIRKRIKAKNTFVLYSNIDRIEFKILK